MLERPIRVKPKICLKRPFKIGDAKAYTPMSKTTGKKRDRSHVFLREWRRYRDLTQVQASDRIGVDQSTIAKIEQGKLPYNEDFLERAALAYGCEPGDLISVNPLAPDDMKALRAILEQAPNEARARALDVLKALLKAS